MSRLDDLYPGLVSGDDAAGLAFYRALADTELFLVLEAEAVGDVVTPRVFDLAEGPVVLAFDSEDRLAGFTGQVLPYAALPGRIVAEELAGQGVSLGLNLGSGAASEVILPPEALVWLTTMMDQAPPEAFEAGVEVFEPPAVPPSVLAALADSLGFVGRAFLAGARYRDGRRGQVLVLTGVDTGAEAKVARSVTEALAFSGLEAAALDLMFLADSDPVLEAVARVAWAFEGRQEPTPEPAAPAAPGMDPARPPILR